jgi:hypothetical protein
MASAMLVSSHNWVAMLGNGAVALIGHHCQENYRYRRARPLSDDCAGDI